MSNRAWVYIWGVFLLGSSISVLTCFNLTVTPADISLFTTLLGLATLAQLFKVEAPSHTLYYATPIFWFAGILLLPPFLYVLLVLVPLLIEWTKERLIHSDHLRAWYLQPFNIAMYTIAGLGARWTYIILDAENTLFKTPIAIFAVISAACMYVFLNHFLLAVALMLARGKSLRESAALDQENLLVEMVLLCLGYLIAIVYGLNPWLIIPTITPLALLYRALKVPQLKQEAQIDAKTGLLNARYFRKRFEEELDRAERFNRPLAFIMADLDLLRTINNTYGHLAGDVVLEGIGQAIRRTIRHYDIAGRFGGEEFAIVLPETDQFEAQVLAERIRKAVEESGFSVATSPTPIHATMSLGIACFPADATTATEINHKADVAVYQAKVQGRNRVICVGNMPHSIELEAAAAESSSMSDYRAALTLNQPVSAVASEAIQSSDTPGYPPSPVAPILEGPLLSSSTSARVEAATNVPEKSQAGRFYAFLGSVICSGLFVSAVACTMETMPDLTILALLMILSIIAELLQVDLYGTGTISVSLAVIFASALITGMPGLIFVSAACAIGAAIALSRSTHRRPQLHKVTFNWSVHVLAATPAAILFRSLAIPLHTSNLPLFAVPLGLAAVAYYLIETGLIATVIGLSTGAQPISVWRERYKWLRDHYIILCGMGLLLSTAYTRLGIEGVIIFGLPILAVRSAQKQYVERTETSMKELQRMNQELAQANHEIIAGNRAIGQLNNELFETLARFFDARDPFVGSHAATVALYAETIAGELGLSKERILQVRQAGYLHDIGKIAIPESILHKPGKLTEEEFEHIKTHTVIGAELLEVSHGLRHLAHVVRHHHERWDGKGYPSGLAGEEIPLESRILNLCDAVEAMASDRPYHKGLSVHAIIAEITRCAGTQFDPTVAAVFVRLAQREDKPFIINSAREVLNKQRIGECAKQQDNTLLACATCTDRYAGRIAGPNQEKMLIGEMHHSG
jgi:diguanylate cyclase (GGDEF)-like protein/putative nucleotidyltransferase with HDIG domain